MKTQRRISIILALCVFLIPMAGVSAVSQEKATIVDFKVTLNGILINNINSDYPLLMYKGITYFPLTWDYSRFLGIETNWIQASGLVITKTDRTCGYKPSENVINKTSEKYSVAIPVYPITVNGEKIDNKKEKWPFINFRGITYFPLTWHYAVNSFGWEYAWSQEKGLVISCPGGKSDPKETVLSLINQMAFGRGYPLKASIIENKSEGTKQEYTGRVENRMDDSNFTSSVYLETPVYFYDAKINGLSTTYEGLNPHQNKGYSLHFHTSSPAGGRAIGLDLMESKEARMMKQLLDFHFIGDNRKKIIGFENMETAHGKSRWKIKTEDRLILLEINDSEGKITETTIIDDLFTYNISF